MCLFIYTDGARKGRDGGWAFIAAQNGIEVHRDSGYEERTSNNRMELLAILRALAWSATSGYLAIDNVIIVTDSKYSIQVITAAPRPNRSVYPLPKNVDLIRQAKSLVTERHKFVWVKGHTGVHWNECADKLATSAVRGIAAKRVFLPRPNPTAPISAFYPPGFKKVLSEA